MFPWFFQVTIILWQNGDHLAHDLSSLNGAPVGTSISFNIGTPGTVNDAGTETNFENLGAGTVDASVAGLGILGAGYVGQSVANTGTVEGGVIANIPVGTLSSALHCRPFG